MRDNIGFFPLFNFVTLETLFLRGFCIRRHIVKHNTHRNPLLYSTTMFIWWSDIFLLYLISEKWTEREIMYVSYVGKLFLRMLKALILPLIVPSLIAAVGALDMSISGKVSFLTTVLGRLICNFDFPNLIFYVKSNLEI